MLIYRHATVLLIAVLSILALQVLGQGFAPEIRLISATGATKALIVRPHAPGWVMIESSSNLVTWSPLVNVSTTNSLVPYLHSSDATAALFYRARFPGQSVTQAMALWKAAQPGAYRYRFMGAAVRITQVVVLESIVTVQDGFRIISDVTANGKPSDHSDEEFPTIEDMFASLAAAEAEGAKLAHAAYDDELGFPSEMNVFRGGDISRDQVGFVITDFEVLR